MREHGRVRPIDIVELLGMPRSSVTRLLDRADAAGLVDRRFVAGDRRVTRCHLTPDGVRAQRHVERIVREAARQALGTEIGALAAPLARLHASWMPRLSGYGLRRFLDARRRRDT
jgi:DNA-binding MarR family transcriptional regulator